MASYRIAAIEKFDFAKPEQWETWIRKFKRFRIASGLKSKIDEEQISTLIYSLGDKAQDLLQSFKMSDEDAAKYDKVLKCFEDHFNKSRNTIYERAKFNCRVQQEGEAVTVDEFIADLYRLVEHCKYGDLQDELVRNRIVVGLRNSELPEKLQLTSGLTLEAAVTRARQSESVTTQQKVVRDEVNIDKLHSRPGASISCGNSKPSTSQRRKPSGLQNSRCQANTVAGVGRLHRTTETSAQLRMLFATNVISKVTMPDTAKPNARLTR